MDQFYQEKGFYPWLAAPCIFTTFSWCQKARQIRSPYYISIASSVQTEKASKIRLPLEPPAKRKKIGTGKTKALAEAVVEEVDFCMDLSVPMKRKELT